MARAKKPATLYRAPDATQDWSHCFIVKLMGDLSGERVFTTFDQALSWTAKAHPVPTDPDDLEGVDFPDVEDDRILILEQLPDGSQHVRWHFSGWHWDEEEFGLPQGCYPGDTECVYRRVYDMVM